MKLQMKSQTAPKVNREATEMTLVLGRRILMMDDVLFQVDFLFGLKRAVSAVKTILNRVGSDIFERELLQITK